MALGGSTVRKDGLHQIGEVAERTQLSLRTIRYYEEAGLAVPSGRTSGGFRLYTDEDIGRLELVKRLKVLDLPLDETKEMLSALEALRSSCPESAEQERLLEQVAEFVDEARNQAALLATRLEAAREALVEVREQLLAQRLACLGERR
jgi:DNA-binding transcriptional MerR regulator